MAAGGRSVRPLIASMTVATRRPSKERTGRPRLTSANLRRFRPELALGFQQDLGTLAAQIAGLPSEDAAAILAVAIEKSDARRGLLQGLGLSAHDSLPTARYAAALRILRDLVVQGWDVRGDDEGLILEAPGRGYTAVADPEREKEALRRSFSFARMAQLHEPATVRFIQDMERRGIRRLFADGNDLAERLASVERAVQPELEVIEPGARETLTGLLLQDVWRYARHFWSIPYLSTPGRNIFYLVRDLSVPTRPLIGIAALGNPVLGLSQRDDYFGWSARGLRKWLTTLDSKGRRRLSRHLFAILSDGIEEVYHADLFPEGPIEGWRQSVAYLAEVERQSIELRGRQLDRSGPDFGRDYELIRDALSAAEKGHESSVDWITLAETALYRRKRASTLADLVRARGILSDWSPSISGIPGIRLFAIPSPGLSGGPTPTRGGASPLFTGLAVNPVVGVDSPLLELYAPDVGLAFHLLHQPGGLVWPRATRIKRSAPPTLAVRIPGAPDE
jgi:hypothetical protein